MNYGILLITSFHILSDPLDPHNLIKDQEFWNLLLQIRSSKSFFFPDPDDPYKLTEDTRTLGLVVCRGTSVVLICPADGMEAIANPFVQQEWWESESKKEFKDKLFSVLYNLGSKRWDDDIVKNYNEV